MLTLYFAPGSSAMAPHIMLHELGVPFESRHLSFARNQHKDPAYLAINPEGKVPTLLIDGRALTEVAGILFYLARAFPDAGLLPVGDIEAESRILSWMSFIAATVHPARRQGLGPQQAALRQAETRLGGGDWAVGAFSIADIHLFRLYWRYATAPDGDTSLFPGLTRHYERMVAKPSVRRTIEIEAALGYEIPTR